MDHRRHLPALGAQDIGAPLLEHAGNDVDLLAIEDGTQSFAGEPGAGGAFGGGLADQNIELGARFGGQPLAVLEQCTAQFFEAGIAPLFKPPGLVEGGRGVGDDMEFVEGYARPGRWSVTTPMNAGDISMLTVVICSGRALCVARCAAKRAMVVASRPSVSNTTLRSSASAAMVK
jgi:hypothetical protein